MANHPHNLSNFALAFEHFLLLTQIGSVRAPFWKEEDNFILGPLHRVLVFLLLELMCRTAPSGADGTR